MFTFDLQLFGGGGGPNQQQQESDQYYQQLANQSNQQFQEWQQYYLPLLKQYGPELMQAIQGQGPLINAAMSPVNAQTSRSLNTMQNNIGGLTNPDAAYADIALNGQQQAGLSADNVLLNSMQALQNLLNTGQSGVGMGMSGLGNAGGGEANLGGQIWNQQNAWWQSLLGGLGQGAGMFTGHGVGGATPSSSGFMPPSAVGSGGVSSFGGAPQVAFDPYSFLTQSNAQPGVSLTQSGGSTPISGGTGSWTGVGPQP